MPDITPRLKMIVRGLFLLFGLFLAGQYLMIRRIAEPYPAIMMPAFNGTGGYKDGQILTKNPVIVFMDEHGDIASFTMKQLLKGFPVSHHGTIAWALFRPLKPGQFQGPLGRRYILFPNLNLATRNRLTSTGWAAITAWMKERGRQLLEGTEPERAEVRWMDVIYVIGSGEVNSSGELEGILTFDFDASNE